MEVVEEVPTTKKIVKRYCDDCGKELYWSLGCHKKQCGTCGKQLCDDCVGHEVEHGGDYHIVYCKSCCSVFDKYKPELDRLYELEQELLCKYEEEAKSKRGEKL